ncbi:MAG TPA: winged helix-turn-helix domain-containing protein [Peptococcaceae bacterium]|nr:winged helix-turn-helix domain-containing protein [Peptococcaceae bacterium]
MLIRILQEIASNQTHSHNSLAKTLNLEPETVKHMFQNLQRMGYIIADDPACGDDRCDECGVCCTKKKKDQKEIKQEMRSGPTRWKLTEKGKEAIFQKP